MCMLLLHLMGLDEDAQYAVWDVDAPQDRMTYSGARLMRYGVSARINDAPKCAIWQYEQIG